MQDRRNDRQKWMRGRLFELGKMTCSQIKGLKATQLESRGAKSTLERLQDER